MSVRCRWEVAAELRLAELDSRPAPLFPHPVTAFFPAYNDAATIGTLVEYVDRLLARTVPDHEIVVVNDGSRDDTGAVLAAVQERVPRLRVITNPRNTGYGAALRAGFAAATREFVFYTDGDGQYDPTELLDLLPHALAADLVNGYKKRRGDGPYRALLGNVYRRVAGWLFGLRIRDVDCDFRLMRRSLLATVPLSSERGSICVELIYQLQQAGARIAEVPVHHYARVAGRSQFLRPARVIASLLYLARLWWTLRARPGFGRVSTRIGARRRVPPPEQVKVGSGK